MSDDCLYLIVGFGIVLVCVIIREIWSRDRR